MVRKALAGALFAGAMAALAIGVADAQPAPPAPAPTQTAPATTPAASAQAIVTRICSRLEVGKQITDVELEFIKACQQALNIQQENLKLEMETAKLTAETQAIKNANADRGFTLLMSFGPLIGALLGVIPVIVGFIAKNRGDRRLVRLQRAKERSERREAHIFQLIEQLSAVDSSRRGFAAAGLIAMIGENLEDVRALPTDMQKERKEDGTELAEHREAISMVATLFGRLRGEGLDEAEAKFIADELGKLLSRQGKREKQIRFSDFNLQQIRARQAYWKGVNASGADFYRSDLTQVSFREAILNKTVFYETNLAGAVFIKASLVEANFQGANLSGANFKGADLTKATNLNRANFDVSTTWDETTIWPEGFSPPRIGG